MPKIRFGTDGWRAVTAQEFTFDNVKLVAQALAFYLQNGQYQKGIVIGYDQRFLADKFAEAVAQVMCGNGIPVFLTAKATPTPVTAFAIKVTDAAGAVMLTASHNPPEYNGIKFIPEYAGPATPQITKQIEHFLTTTTQVNEMPMKEARAKGLLRSIQPDREYLEHLRTLVDTGSIKESKLRVIIDPMHGAGIGYLESFLGQLGCELKVRRGYRDPLFGGNLPEPTKKELEGLARDVVDWGAHLGLALDGDADRFGIIDADGTYLSPNQVLPLLYDYLLEDRGWQGPAVRTVATTHMLDRIAEYHGETVQETPVGFKYIGQSLLHRGTILGGEESGGLSIKGHIPEKDGLLACALLVELAAKSKQTLGHRLQKLSAKYGQVVSERVDIPVSFEDKERVLNELPKYQPVKLAGIPVTGRITVDGTKLVLADGSWMLLRPSGTEPLFRLYVEASDRNLLEQIRKEVRQELNI